MWEGGHWFLTSHLISSISLPFQRASTSSPSLEVHCPLSYPSHLMEFSCNLYLLHWGTRGLTVNDSRVLEKIIKKENKKIACLIFSKYYPYSVYINFVGLSLKWKYVPKGSRPPTWKVCVITLGLLTLSSRLIFIVVLGLSQANKPTYVHCLVKKFFIGCRACVLEMFPWCNWHYCERQTFTRINTIVSSVLSGCRVCIGI